MSNNLNNYKVTSTEKFLICKNDPTIDVGYIKRITQSGNAVEILNANTQSQSLDMDSEIFFQIFLGFQLLDSYSSQNYRIFSVDNTGFLTNLDSNIVHLLEFNEYSYNDFCLCIRLLKNMVKIEYRVEDLLMDIAEYSDFTDHGTVSITKIFLRDSLPLLRCEVLDKQKDLLKNRLYF
jgi:pyruvate formate-lyase activating enzyme-like uncharacterized protein